MGSSSPRTRPRVVALLASTGLVLSLLAWTGATTAAAGPTLVDNGVQRHSAAADAAVRHYWTPARMAAAKPYPLPTGTGGPGVASAPAPAGKPGSVNGKAPGATGGPAAVLGRAFRALTSAPIPAVSNYAYPFPYSRWYVDTILYPGTYPYIAVGKVFFTQNGGSYVCSASSVSSSTTGLRRPVLWTAGHCLADGKGHWSTNVLFVPAYENGAAPYGTFPCGTQYVWGGWFSAGDFTWDMGSCAIRPNALGQTLPSRVGALGFAWNQSRNQHWSEFGYPAGAPFNGQWLTVCESSHAVDDTAIPGTGADPVGVGCDMTGGSSGGPWIVWFKIYNQVNGHNDYKYTSPSQPGAMYSPYYNTYANALRCAAATGAATATC